jgi:ribosomal protein L29
MVVTQGLEQGLTHFRKDPVRGIARINTVKNE